MSIKNFRVGNVKNLGALLLCATLMSVAPTVTYATGLNGIGVTQTTENQENNNDSNTNTDTNVDNDDVVNNDADTSETSNAEAVGMLFDNLGPGAEDFARAKVILEPMSKGANLLTAIILGAVSLVLMLITCLDVAYIAIPFVRRHLDGNRSAGQQSGGGMYDSQNTSSANSGLAQWVSDEAIAAYREANPQQNGGSGMMTMQQQAPASKKMMITSYIKKRLIFFFCFGLCLTLLFTTLFTNLGVNLGVWIIGKITGLL